MRKSRILGFVLMSSSISGTAFAYPAQVIIIRHGEKDTGNQLDQRGCERAFALPSFFSPANPALNLDKFPPAAVFALEPKDATSSERPLETITPTAVKLGLPLQDPFKRTDYAQMKSAVMDPKSTQYDGKTVIISWQHGVIPELAKEVFGLKLNSHTKKWPGKVFDEAWVLKFSKDGKISSFKIVPEHVLPGDNPLGGEKNWGKAGAADSDPPCLTQTEVLSCTDNTLLNSMMAAQLAK